MIDGIDVSMIDDTNYINKYGNKLRILENVKRINVFIGENNSGKSRMLRNLIKEDSMNILSNSFLTDNNKESGKERIRSIQRTVGYFNNYSSNVNINLPQNLEELSLMEQYMSINECIESLEINSDDLSSTAKSYFKSIQSYLRDIYGYLARAQDYAGPTKSVNKCDVIYIPVLRGIENFNQYFNLTKSKDLDSITMNEDQRKALNEYKSNAKHLYLNKVRKAYEFINSDVIFTAEDLYDEITAKLLGEEKGRNFIRDFQSFISKEFYDGEEFTLIPQQNKGYLNVKIGQESERALHNLGDGIKQLITILYKVFEKKDKQAIFFIEEPEINLHPGYQRKLIQILQSDIFQNHQFFITTHSNHFVDSCFDYSNISIYKFININKTNNTFQVINTSPNDIELLQLLGVNNSSVFLSNCTIWVEGISDKILISKYLDVYFKSKGISKYKEDINYSFVEYGGNNITHWSFIPTEEIATINSSGITNRCFIVCDNDNDSERKQERKKKLCCIFGENNYCELTVREIENTISRKVLEKTLFPDGNVEYREDYEGNLYANKSTYMGSFIDSHYKLKKHYSNSSGTGTINNKLEFSKKVVANINDISDLSTQAINMCKKIEKFIESSNNF